MRWAAPTVFVVAIALIEWGTRSGVVSALTLPRPSDVLAVFESKRRVHAIDPDFRALTAFDARGVIGNLIQYLADDPGLSLKASTPLTWITLMVYGVWHAAPFAFVVFYAGLQTVPQDTMEAAEIDGATRWQQVKYVVIPHLMPLVTFVALIQLMDNFRVFEPIIGFNASAHAQSLSWIIFNDLGGETRQLSSAAANSVLTIIGVAILLSPVLVRTWRDFNRKT